MLGYLKSDANVAIWSQRHGYKNFISDFNCAPIGSTQDKGGFLSSFKDHVTTFEGEVKFMVN